MDLLRIAALGSSTLMTLQPRHPPAPGTVQAPLNPSAPPELAQNLFQGTLQTAAASPWANPSLVDAGQLPDITAALLAALNSPAVAPPAPLVSTPGTATATAAPPPVDTPAAPGANPTGDGPDFPLQTALRFGAGIGPLPSPQFQAPMLDAGLVRDAASVQRLRNLQSHGGSPGPEAFTHPRAAEQRASHINPPPAAAEAATGLDLLA
jgi:hypothetical protein